LNCPVERFFVTWVFENNNNNNNASPRPVYECARVREKKVSMEKLRMKKIVGDWKNLELVLGFHRQMAHE